MGRDDATGGDGMKTVREQDVQWQITPEGVTLTCQRCYWGTRTTWHPHRLNGVVFPEIWTCGHCGQTYCREGSRYEKVSRLGRKGHVYPGGVKGRAEVVTA